MDNKSDPLRLMAEELVNTQHGISPEVREKLIEDLIKSMERFINAEIIAQLDDEQAEKFVEFMQANPNQEEVINHLKNNGVNLQQAISNALFGFKQAYLGNN